MFKSKLMLFSAMPMALLLLFVVAGYQNFLSSSISLEKPLLIKVEAGDNLTRLLIRLKTVTKLPPLHWFKLLVKLNPELSQIKQGTYQLDKDMTPKKLLELLSSGKEHQFQFTLIEGENIWQLKQKLKQHENLRSEDWSELNTEFKYLEGAFYPDTYAYTEGSGELSILQLAHNRLINKLEQLWQSRATGLPFNNSYEALILASIIEKETSIASERATIASVFVNRLNKGMRLQTDPTVIYGIGEHFDGDIKRSDMRKKTPYNTYVIKGLPPTPISMVSEAAIKAALNPEQTDYLYFVATGDGGHQFSKTLKQHNQALQSYLKKLAERKG